MTFGFAVALTLLATCVGCRSRAEQPAPARTIVSVYKGARPSMSTNQVLEIAHGLALGRHYKMDEYICETITLEPDPADPEVPKEWRLHFVRKRPTPDSDFFVIVEDRTGKGELWHW